YFNRLDANRIRRFLEPDSERPRLDPRISPLDEPRDWLRPLKRRYWFEGSTAVARESDVETPDHVGPYRYLDVFEEALRLMDETARTIVLLGLSRADGVPARLLPDGLGFRMGGQPDGFVVVKVFPADEFRLEAP